jgi:hypothetical protein
MNDQDCFNSNTDYYVFFCSGNQYVHEDECEIATSTYQYFYEEANSHLSHSQ